jgi:hypothetical protein
VWDESSLRIATVGGSFKRSATNAARPTHERISLAICNRLTLYFAAMLLASQ